MKWKEWDGGYSNLSNILTRFFGICWDLWWCGSWYGLKVPPHQRKRVAGGGEEGYEERNVQSIVIGLSALSTILYLFPSYFPRTYYLNPPPFLAYLHALSPCRCRGSRTCLVARRALRWSAASLTKAPTQVLSANRSLWFLIPFAGIGRMGWFASKAQRSFSFSNTFWSHRGTLSYVFFLFSWPLFYFFLVADIPLYLQAAVDLHECVKRLLQERHARHLLVRGETARPATVKW